MGPPAPYSARGPRTARLIEAMFDEIEEEESRMRARFRVKALADAPRGGRARDPFAEPHSGSSDIVFDESLGRLARGQPKPIALQVPVMTSRAQASAAAPAALRAEQAVRWAHAGERPPGGAAHTGGAAATSVPMRTSQAPSLLVRGDPPADSAVDRARASQRAAFAERAAHATRCGASGSPSLLLPAAPARPTAAAALLASLPPPQLPLFAQLFDQPARRPPSPRLVPSPAAGTCSASTADARARTDRAPPPCASTMPSLSIAKGTPRFLLATAARPLSAGSGAQRAVFGPAAIAFSPPFVASGAPSTRGAATTDAAPSSSPGTTGTHRMDARSPPRAELGTAQASIEARVFALPRAHARVAVRARARGARPSSARGDGARSRAESDRSLSIAGARASCGASSTRNWASTSLGQLDAMQMQQQMQQQQQQTGEADSELVLAASADGRYHFVRRRAHRTAEADVHGDGGSDGDGLAYNPGEDAEGAKAGASALGDQTTLSSRAALSELGSAEREREHEELLHGSCALSNDGGGWQLGDGEVPQNARSSHPDGPLRRKLLATSASAPLMRTPARESAFGKRPHAERVPSPPPLAVIDIAVARDELAARRLLDGARARAGEFGQDAKAVLCISRDRAEPAMLSVGEFVRGLHEEREADARHARAVAHAR
ncbi:hypothetical protein KFE25_003488 [Diacronema lutheri]|uniref:Uncharacterized protein n=2 Tax=Diacronema lutheri TaxID=2081491 RepID=A0A8J5XS50_DIALT|nr:hypothetical protein KFE25_003488 [Diacronema lutheri]